MKFGILVFIVAAIMFGSCNGNSDSMDFGDCTKVSDSVQSCTYRDGHTEILNLSDSTVR